VELSSSFNDTDKVHYTLDGSEPTVNSPMYNWVASRWSNRSDYKEINCPIEIKKDTTIKAVVIGPGKRNSDVVEFKYTVAEGSAVFGISGDVSADYSLGRLQALGKTTGEYRYTSGEKLITEQCTGVLLADVLASEGITDPAAKVTILTTDGYLHDSYEVTLKAVRDGNYLVTYQVNNESFEDISKDGKTTSQIRIYRNHDDGSGWLNRLTMISGVSVAGSAVSPGDWTLQLRLLPRIISNKAWPAALPIGLHGLMKTAMNGAGCHSGYWWVWSMMILIQIPLTIPLVMILLPKVIVLK
jgi:hypothetical protein